MRKAVLARSAYLALGLALAGRLAAKGTIVAAPAAQRPMVVINEVQYDPPTSGSEAAYEWLELRNADAGPVKMSGWQIGDNRSASALPDLELASGEFVVVAAGDGFEELHPGFAGRVVRLDGRIGNGLGNSGDQVRLLNALGELVDGMSYGDDVGLLNPSVPGAPAGHSLERYPAGADTDSAADWIDQPSPTPGEAAGDNPRPPTSEHPVPTAAFGDVALNEFLAAPRDVDWDGDGTASANDEWIELTSLADVDMDLRGWQLDDVADGGSAPFVLPEGTVLRSRGYLLFFRRDSKIVLNNDRDTVRLLRPDGSSADEMEYPRTVPDGSYARLPDGSGPWTDSLSPSPGGPNGSPHPTPTPAGPTQAPSATPGEGRATPTRTVGPTTTPGAVRPTPTRPGQPTAGPGATVVPTPAYLPMVVTEVLYDALASGDDSAYEWLELFNRSDAPVRTKGWAVGDAVSWDSLGDQVVPPRGYLVVVASRDVAREVEASGAAVWVVPDGRIGNGLANKGDLVRVRDPTGLVGDAVSYGGNLDAFDPAVPLVPPGWSIERIPRDQDTDCAEDWWPQPVPSPGQAGVLQSQAPEVVINELLPAPRTVDWDASGASGFTDEWLELYNRSAFPVDLAGWRLTVGEPERWSFRFRDGQVIAARGFRVIHRAESGLALGNRADEVRLVRRDGMVADVVSWETGPSYDRSLCRLPDGGDWRADCQATPGEANRLAPSPSPPAAPTPLATRVEGPKPAADYRDLGLAAVRQLADGQAVALRGVVLAPAGLFGARTMYIGDASSGLRLYLGVRNGALPTLPVGSPVAARGTLGSYHGERQLVLSHSTEVWLDDWAWPPIEPVPVASGAMGEEFEGRLVVVRGRVTRLIGSAVWLDDGSGECRIRIDPRTKLRRPPLRRGQRWAVAGIVSQYAARRPYEGGYRLMPRFATDLGLPLSAATKGPGRAAVAGSAALRRSASPTSAGPGSAGPVSAGAGAAHPAFAGAASAGADSADANFAHVDGVAASTPGRGTTRSVKGAQLGTSVGSPWTPPSRWSLRDRPPVPF